MVVNFWKSTFHGCAQKSQFSNSNLFSVVVSQLNEGQTGGPVGVDINVLPVWRKGISGKGVVVSILDDGG